MKEALFACDIDNTLIYSRKRPHEGFPCVEWIHGEEQAYMSPTTYARLADIIARHLFIPVTSRSVEQYGRICFPHDRAPEWAVTTNGAVLLHHGKPDEAWTAQSQTLFGPWREELWRMHVLLSPDGRFIRCRIVDDAYLFVYCGRDTSPRSVAEELSARTGLHVLASGKKVYLLPPELNKGTAVLRLRERFSCETLLCAGDSDMDLPMLNLATCALMPEALRTAWQGHGRCICCGPDSLFSDFVTAQGLALLESR